MFWLLLGMALFFGVHLIPSLPTKRAALIAWLGERRYKATFSIFAFVGLALMIKGMGVAAPTAFWQPAAATRFAPMVLMLPALVLLVASQLPCHIKQIARHPMSLGILLWSLGHLAANGETPVALFFAGFAAYALFDLSRNRPLNPGKSPSLKMDALAVGVGILAYWLLITLHEKLFGVPAIVWH